MLAVNREMDVLQRVGRSAYDRQGLPTLHSKTRHRRVGKEQKRLPQAFSRYQHAGSSQPRKQIVLTELRPRPPLVAGLVESWIASLVFPKADYL